MPDKTCSLQDPGAARILGGHVIHIDPRPTTPILGGYTIHIDLTPCHSRLVATLSRCADRLPSSSRCCRCVAFSCGRRAAASENEPPPAADVRDRADAVAARADADDRRVQAPTPIRRTVRRSTSAAQTPMISSCPAGRRRGSRSRATVATRTACSGATSAAAITTTTTARRVPRRLRPLLLGVRRLMKRRPPRSSPRPRLAGPRRGPGPSVPYHRRARSSTGARTATTS